VSVSEYAPPVLYRHNVYYPRTKAELAEFIAAPRKFARMTPNSLAAAPKCFVMGSVRSGRSSIAQKISRDLGATYVSMEDVLSRLLAGESALRDQAEGFLRKGQAIPDELCVKALVRALGSYACVRDGWVVDGFPMTVTQAQMLEELGVVPQNVFLTAPVPAVAASAGANPALKPQMFQEAITAAADACGPALAELKQFYSSMHECCVHVPEDGSQWQRGAHAASVLWETAKRQTLRLVSQRDDKAVEAAGMGLSPVQVQACMGKFVDYCPVTLKETQAMAKCAPGLGLTIEYRGQLYKMQSSACAAKFMADPTAYLDGISLLAAPARGRVPIPLPATPAAAGSDLALDGHCPVTLWLDNRDRRCVVPGVSACQVQYGDLVFKMANPTAKQAFLERPWVYSDQVLPAKMPAVRALVQLDRVPARGYCEQTLARAVTAALNGLCEHRPKYPGLSVEDSVLKYLALHLRSNNKKENEEHHEVSQKLYDEYVDCCELAAFLETQPRDAENYREKQKKFEATRAKPWDTFLQNQMK